MQIHIPGLSKDLCYLVTFQEVISAAFSQSEIVSLKHTEPMTLSYEDFLVLLKDSWHIQCYIGFNVSYMEASLTPNIYGPIYGKHERIVIITW